MMGVPTITKYNRLSNQKKAETFQIFFLKCKFFKETFLEIILYLERIITIDLKVLSHDP